MVSNIETPEGLKGRRTRAIIAVSVIVASLFFVFELSSYGLVSTTGDITSLLSTAVGKPAASRQRGESSPACSKNAKVLAGGTTQGLPEEVVMSEAFLQESNINTTALGDLSHGTLRSFRPHGIAVHYFLDFGTYRSSPRAFSCAGSISRAVEDAWNPPFECEWVNPNGTVTKSENVVKYRPGREFHAVYDSLIVICHFGEDIGTDGKGGELFISYSYPANDPYRLPEKFLAFTEAPGVYEPGMFEPPFLYDVAYCGSPIYGNVSPQRVREWIAYHAYMFGEKSHFIFYDAGGFHGEVQRILQPWVDKGRVSVQNVRQLMMYSGYYFHQHTIVNDCLFRSQYMANWTFFFDIDEYVYVNSSATNLTALLAEKEGQDLTVMQFDQKRMSHALCALPEDAKVDNSTRDAQNAKLWGFEKLVFSMHWKNNRPEAHKYAVQGRKIWVTEIHNVVHMKGGKRWNVGYDRIWFHHFHGTLTTRDEVCKHFADAAQYSDWFATPVFFENANYSTDYTLAQLGGAIKEFELATIGQQPFIL